MIVCSSIMVAVAAIIAFTWYQQHSARVFNNGNLAITLRLNGTFTARLAHDKKEGTYSESAENGITTVYFVSDGITVKGSITDKVLTIPNEWDDHHGHGTRFIMD